MHMSSNARVDPQSGFCNLKIQALNPEIYCAHHAHTSIQALNLEIASKSEPNIYKIQCMNLDIARDT